MGKCNVVNKALARRRTGQARPTRSCAVRRAQRCAQRTSRNGLVTARADCAINRVTGRDAVADCNQAQRPLLPRPLDSKAPRQDLLIAEADCLVGQDHSILGQQYSKFGQDDRLFDRDILLLVPDDSTFLEGDVLVIE